MKMPSWNLCLRQHEEFLIVDQDLLEVSVEYRFHSLLFVLMSMQLYNHLIHSSSSSSSSSHRHSPSLLNITQCKVSLAFQQLHFDQQLFVIEFLQFFQQLRSQSQSFVVSMRIIVQSNETSLAANIRSTFDRSDQLTSSSCRRNVRFSLLAHSMLSWHKDT